jgi:DNA segregation ATPase FtsK/SpoIIIE, S-DNA-T family
MTSITDGMKGRFATRHAAESYLRHVGAFAGFLFLVGAFLLVALLATYNHNDPSWDHAIDAGPTNLLGIWGAIIADGLVQGFGAAALLLPMVALDWAVRLISGRWLHRFWFRVVLVPPILVAAALALAIVPPPPAWPAAVSFGGAIGTVMRHYLDPFGGSAPVSAMAAAAMAGLLLLYVSGFDANGVAIEAEDDDEAVETAPPPTPQPRKPRKPLFGGLFTGLFARSMPDDRLPAARERREPVIGPPDADHHDRAAGGGGGAQPRVVKRA